MQDRQSVKNTVTFFVFSGGAVLAAVLVPWLAAKTVLVWAAGSLAAAGSAYAGLGPRVFAKRGDGTLPVWAWVLFGAFLIPNAVCFHLYRLFAGEPPWHEVSPGLYLGRRLTRREAGREAPPGLAGVLDLTCELPEPRAMRRFGAYLCLPVLDGTSPTVEQLRTAVEWIARTIRSGAVYVHCAVGHGRSVTVAVGYLLAAGLAEDVGEALAMVRAKRPRARLCYGGPEVVRRFRAEGTAAASAPVRQ